MTLTPIFAPQGGTGTPTGSVSSTLSIARSHLVRSAHHAEKLFLRNTRVKAVRQSHQFDFTEEAVSQRSPVVKRIYKGGAQCRPDGAILVFSYLVNYQGRYIGDTEF